MQWTKVSCKSIIESRNNRTASPYIGQAYKGDGGSKSGLKDWTGGMENAAVRVGCAFSVCVGFEASSKRQCSFFFFTFHCKCICLSGERSCSEKSRCTFWKCVWKHLRQTVTWLCLIKLYWLSYFSWRADVFTVCTTQSWFDYEKNGCNVSVPVNGHISKKKKKQHQGRFQRLWRSLWGHSK